MHLKEKILYDSKIMELCSKGLDLLEDFSVSMVKKIILGKYIRIIQKESKYNQIVEKLLRYS